MSDRGWRDRALVQLTLARYREFFREPEAVFWVFVFPVLLAAGLGLAFQQRGPERMPVAVVGEAERYLPALLTDSGLTAQALDNPAAQQALRTGRIVLFVSIEGDSLQYHFDPARPEALAARLAVDEALQGAAGRQDPLVTSQVTSSAAGSRYIDFVIPGLLGMNLMGSGIWGLGFTIVDSRRKKLLKRLIATPMPKGQYLASFLISRLTLLVIEVGVLLGFGAWVFGVPVRGSAVLLVVTCLVSALAFSALGLLLASRAQTVEGVSGLMNLVMLPMWIFSGVFFSAERFPQAVQPFIQALPLTAAVDALRLHMLEGAGWRLLAPELAILSTWLVVCFVVALKLFRWR